MKPSRIFLLAALVAMAGPPAIAEQPRVALNVDVKEEISRTDAQGRIQVVHQPVERAEPGDVLVYTLTYTNVGGNPAVNAKVDDPIPSGTILLPGSVSGDRALITFSVDGGKNFFAFPAKVTEVGLDGRSVEKEAPADRYTHIRWSATDPLAPGETRSAAFKVVVR